MCVFSLTLVHCFQRCISLSPETGHAKYLYLGQLSSGEEAVGCLTKGIAIMERAVGRESQTGPLDCEDITNEDISTAYCTLAEVYLTDSW